MISIQFNVKVFQQLQADEMQISTQVKSEKDMDAKAKEVDTSHLPVVL